MSPANNEVLEIEVATLKEQLGELAKKREEDNKRIWERIDQQAIETVRLQVLMEGVSKTLDEVKLALQNIGNNIANESKDTNGKWSGFFEKGFWLAVGVAVTYITKKF